MIKEYYIGYYKYTDHIGLIRDISEEQNSRINFEYVAQTTISKSFHSYLMMTQMNIIFNKYIGSSSILPIPDKLKRFSLQSFEVEQGAISIDDNSSIYWFRSEVDIIDNFNSSILIQVQRKGILIIKGYISEAFYIDSNEMIDVFYEENNYSIMFIENHYEYIKIQTFDDDDYSPLPEIYLFYSVKE